LKSGYGFAVAMTISNRFAASETVCLPGRAKPAPVTERQQSDAASSGAAAAD
jgi:hypothetical protein